MSKHFHVLLACNFYSLSSRDNKILRYIFILFAPINIIVLSDCSVTHLKYIWQNKQTTKQNPKDFKTVSFISFKIVCQLLFIIQSYFLLCFSFVYFNIISWDIIALSRKNRKIYVCASSWKKKILATYLNVSSYNYKFSLFSIKTM